MGMLAKYAAAKATEQVARYIPVIGTAVASGISFQTAKMALNAALHELKQGALVLLDEKIRKSKMKVMDA